MLEDTSRVSYRSKKKIKENKKKEKEFKQKKEDTKVTVRCQARLKSFRKVALF